MAIYDNLAAFGGRLCWWKTATPKWVTGRVFTKYPSELLENEPACTPGMYTWATKPTDEDGHFLWPFSNQHKYYGPGSRLLAPKNLEQVSQRVAPCVRLIDIDAGNIIPLVAADLNHKFAEQERALLPVLDYAHPYFDHGVTVECKDMLRPIMARAQKQHAHNLKVNGMVDILIEWKCMEIVFPWASDYIQRRTMFVGQHDWEVLKKAWDCHYDVLDWDEQYFKYKPGPGRGPEVRRPMPNRKGGFYAVVTDQHYAELEDFVERYKGKMEITVLIEPNRMTPDEQAEMQEYHAKRAGLDCETSLSAEDMEIARRQREKEEVEYLQRKKNTFAAARQRGIDIYGEKDFRVGFDYTGTDGNWVF